MGALRFNVGAVQGLPKVVSRRAERRLDEIELFRLLTAVEKKPRDNSRRILSVLRPTAEKVDELRGLPDKQLLDDWFTEFTRRMQSLAAPRRGQRARRSDHRDR
jgi:hypothetical protein